MKIFRILCRLHISDDESNEEEFSVSFAESSAPKNFPIFISQQQNAPKFFSNRTMPKFNQNPFNLNARQTFAPSNEAAQMKGIPVVPLINPRIEMRQHVNVSQINHHQRKIPPPPPPRSIFRSDPEGMQQTPAVNEEKKGFQMAAVQHTNMPRIPPKPFINFGHQQRHLLNQITPNHFVFGKAQNVNLNNSFNNTNLHHQLPPKSQFTHFPTIHHNSNSNQMFHKAKQQLVHKQMPLRMTGVMNEYAENRAEKSDPENHIYEMIDEYEVNSNIFQVPNHPTIADETKANSNLFQNLLRAEMMNQIQSCSKIGNNGYLSHLPQQKRMDIIQETALSLASAAYLEK